MGGAWGKAPGGWVAENGESQLKRGRGSALKNKNPLKDSGLPGTITGKYRCCIPALAGFSAVLLQEPESINGLLIGKRGIRTPGTLWARTPSKGVP